MLPREAQGLLEQPVGPGGATGVPCRVSRGCGGGGELSGAGRERAGAKAPRRARHVLAPRRTRARSTAPSSASGSERSRCCGSCSARRSMSAKKSMNVPDADPRSSQVAVYRYLSWLQGEVIDALAAAPPFGGARDRGHSAVSEGLAAAAHDHGLGRDRADDGEGPPSGEGPARARRRTGCCSTLLTDSSETQTISLRARWRTSGTASA